MLKLKTMKLEQTLLQLTMAKSVAEAKQLCTTDLDDFDDEEDEIEDFLEKKIKKQIKSLFPYHFAAYAQWFH
jgi:hypothetical protein